MQLVLIQEALLADFELAAKMNPGVPVFSSETYPGWLTHWGEKWAKPDTAELLKEVKFLMDNKKSFNFYVIHGGTNFGYTAGANSGGKGYEPDVTSYDYDAPINEQGHANSKIYGSSGNLLVHIFQKGKNFLQFLIRFLQLKYPAIDYAAFYISLG